MPVNVRYSTRAGTQNVQHTTLPKQHCVRDPGNAFVQCPFAIAERYKGHSAWQLPYTEITKQPSVCDCLPSARYGSECTRCGNRRGLCSNDRGPCYIGGWLQQGFTGNFGSPQNRKNAPVLFNDRANDYRLNQLYFFAEKAVHANPSDWNLGGRIDVLLGTDARFVTVPGLERHRDRTPKWAK